jgi:4-amino-4-deoxy-L-arabinose transferase-like glycosyltransferase
MKAWLADHAILLVPILVGYLLLGSLYALFTPPWQTPDEPAHFNYVRHIAETGTLPELQRGDYPAEYLEQLKTQRFSPELSIAPVRYESHQPPLYYLLAAGVYRLVGGQDLVANMRVLRLFSLLLGACTLALSYATVVSLFPGQMTLAGAVTCFAATLPMHLSMTTAVNSDALSELLAVASILLVVRSAATGWSKRRAVAIGLLLGLALLTKMQAYVAVALALAGLAWDGMVQGTSRLGRVLRLAATMVGTALLVALPWLLRNASVYGWGDLLAMARHDQVVQGQFTTLAYVAQHGLGALLKSGVLTTFQSFWGQFGWMAVPMPPRVYTLLAVACGVSAIGLVGALITGALARLTMAQRRSLLLLAVWLLVTTAGFVWWNLRFLQHQGRYLFPALVPIGVGLVMGLAQAVKHWRLTAGALFLGAAVTLAAGLTTGDVKGFTLMALLAACLLVAALHRWCPSRPRLGLLAYGLGMGAFAVYCLPAYIVPFLAP